MVCGDMSFTVFVGHAVYEIDENRQQISRIEGLSERHEIWQVDRWKLAAQDLGTLAHGVLPRARNTEGFLKKIIALFSYII